MYEIICVCVRVHACARVCGYKGKRDRKTNHDLNDPKASPKT